MNPEQEQSPLDAALEAFDYSIDVSRLQFECSRQASVFHDAALELNHLTADLKCLKIEFDRCKAELSLNVRSNPEAFGISKVTESTIDAVITGDEKVQGAQNEMMAVERRIAMYQAHRDALYQRASLLKAEVELFIGSYFQPDIDSVGNKGRALAEKGIAKARQEKAASRKTKKGGGEEDDANDTGALSTPHEPSPSA